MIFICIVFWLVISKYFIRELKPSRNKIFFNSRFELLELPLKNDFFCQRVKLKIKTCILLLFLFKWIFFSRLFCFWNVEFMFTFCYHSIKSISFISKVTFSLSCIESSPLLASLWVILHFITYLSFIHDHRWFFKILLWRISLHCSSCDKDSVYLLWTIYW